MISSAMPAFCYCNVTPHGAQSKGLGGRERETVGEGLLSAIAIPRAQRTDYNSRAQEGAARVGSSCVERQGWCSGRVESKRQRKRRRIEREKFYDKKGV
jgi:hypothetical protein